VVEFDGRAMMAGERPRPVAENGEASNARETMKSMIRKLALGVLLWAAAWTARAELTVYYVRHAEGGHNVKKDFVARGVPKDQWPAWVGNPDVSPDRGSPGAGAGDEHAAREVRPDRGQSLWRTRHTILPY